MPLVPTVRRSILSIAAAMLCSFAFQTVSATVLITDEEAKLQKPALPKLRAGVGRGPSIEVLSPASGEAVKSPFELRLRFKAFQGARIDIDTLEAKYMTEPKVPISSRMRPHADEAGLRILDAEAPPGRHPVMITVRDDKGRVATTYIELQVK